MEKVTGMSKPLKEMSVKNNPNLLGISVNDSGLEKVTFKNNPKLETVSLGRDKALKFVDDAKISDYAKNYVYALANAGILKGDDKNNFRPTDNLTRAEAASIIVRANEYLNAAK